MVVLLNRLPKYKRDLNHSQTKFSNFTDVLNYQVNTIYKQYVYLLSITIKASTGTFRILSELN